MHQTFDARLDFHEAAIVGKVRHLAEHAGAGGVTAGEAHPRIFAQLLQPQGDAVLVLVELEHHGADFVADIDHFGGVLDPAPSQVGDVQQAVDATQIHEGAVFGDVLDDALDRGAFLQVRQQAVAFRAHAGFKHGLARHHDIVALAVQLDDLEFGFLVFVRRGVLDRTHVHQGTGQKGADAIDHDGEAALDLAVHQTLDDAALFHRRFQVQPGGETARAIARQLGGAETVFNGFDGDLHEIAHNHFQPAPVILEFFCGNQAFGLEAGVDGNEVVVDGNDLGGNDLTMAHLLLGDAFFEHGGKRFHGIHGGLGGSSGH